MENSLTFFLLRTRSLSPKGLKLKLKIHKVNKYLEFFDEQQDPAATILSHGLFLVHRTPESVRDPMLIGVLNQPVLRDHEPKNKFGVFLSSLQSTNFRTPRPETEQPNAEELPHNALGKRVAGVEQPPILAKSARVWRTQRVALFRNGIVKELPPSEKLDSFLSLYFRENAPSVMVESVTTISVPNHMSQDVNFMIKPENLHTAPLQRIEDLAYLLPATKFIHFMQSVVETHHADIQSKTSKLEEGDPELQRRNHMHYIRTGKINQQSLDPEWSFESLSFINTSVEELNWSLAYFKNFLLPGDSIDKQVFLSHIANCQRGLSQLVSALPDLLIEPFCEALSKVSTNGSKHSISLTNHVSEWLRKLRAHLQRFPTRALITVESEVDSRFQLNEDEKLNVVLDNALLKALSSCLNNHVAFRKTFLKLVGLKLKEYPLAIKHIAEEELDPRSASNVAKDHLLDFQETYIVEEYSRIKDIFLGMYTDQRFCFVRSAKMKHTLRFAPKLYPAHKSQLEAIVFCQDTTLCFFKEFKHVQPVNSEDSECEESSIQSRIFLKILQKETETAVIAMPEDYWVGYQDAWVKPIEHFTGRFLVTFDRYLHDENNQIFMLDLWPCTESVPKLPLLYELRISQTGDQFSMVPIVYSCTDKFFSYFAANPSDLNTDGLLQDTPKELKIIRFDAVVGLVYLPPIPCNEQFKMIFSSMGEDKFNQENQEHTKMCWTRDLKQLFFLNWIFEESYDDESEIDQDYTRYDKTIAFACFAVNKDLTSLKTLAYHCFNMNLLIKEDISSKHRPRFSTLHSRTKDYLVMDLIKPEPWQKGYHDRNSATTIHARALFTVHRNQIHWVPVNGQLLYHLPRHIGDQVQNAGYDTSYLSLFHKRRIFSSDKVVYCLSRLEYKPL